MNHTPETDALDPDDLFKDTRMSFGDHIEDLRTHLIRAIVYFVIGMTFSLFFLGQYVMKIIVAPVEEQLDRFEAKMLNRNLLEARETAKQVGQKVPPIWTTIKINKKDWEAQKPKLDPPLLDGMMIGIESLLNDLDLIDALDKEAQKEIVNYVEVRMQITDPMAFNEQTQRIATKVKKARLSTMNITEAFMVYFKVAMMTGLVISSPWVFYHIWAFIAAGLYPSEKRLVHVYLPFSLFLFLSGVMICQFMVMPKAVEAMLWFNEWLGLSADLRLNEWLSFALMMPIVFGLSFQTPLVMMFLHKAGIVSVQAYREKRRVAWFVMAIFAALITPSVDAFSMLFLWVPMGALYELGILLCVYQGEHEELAEWEKEERGELVEV